MLSKDQEQRVGDGSTAIQAKGDVTITNIGATYAEVRDIALDVFRANFYQLAGVAKETAKLRAEEITEDFLLKLQNEYPKGLEKSHDPDFQFALFTVQKEYARIGDKDLGDLLVDLLVERSKREQRDILQVVLNESLSTAPKLTESQLAALAVVFLFSHPCDFEVDSDKLLGEFLDKYVAPFVPKLVKNMACYQHLEFSGCGAIQIRGGSLESILGLFYPGPFIKGFDAKEVKVRRVSIGLDKGFFIPCVNDPSKLQIRTKNMATLEADFEEANIGQDDRIKISSLFFSGMMTDTEIREKCIRIRPYMTKLFETWSASEMKNFTLTTVGIAIGHANIKRIAGEFADLSMWIN